MSQGLNEHDLNYIKFKFKLSLYDIIASTNSAFDIKLLRNLNWKLWKEELEKKKNYTYIIFEIDKNMIVYN